MKLHAIQTRSPAGQDKRAGDAWDIYRPLLDLDADGSIRDELIAAPPTLRLLVREAAERVLLSEAARTRTWLRTSDHLMSAVTVEQLRHVGQPLVDALR